MDFRLAQILAWLLLGSVCHAAEYQCDTTRSCGCGSSAVEMTARILGGEEAVPYSWSMVVSIRYDFLGIGDPTMHFCGGTILTDSYVLTAANCVEGVQADLELAEVSIAAGIHLRSQPRQALRRVDQIVFHPNWTGSLLGYHHDLALLHLSEPLNFETNTFLSRTCLPSKAVAGETTHDNPDDERPLAMVGWGRTDPGGSDSDELRQATVSYIDSNTTECIQTITDPHGQFCAGVTGSNTGEQTLSQMVLYGLIDESLSRYRSLLWYVEYHGPKSSACSHLFLITRRFRWSTFRVDR